MSEGCVWHMMLSHSTVYIVLHKIHPLGALVPVCAILCSPPPSLWVAASLVLALCLKGIVEIV